MLEMLPSITDIMDWGNSANPKPDIPVPDGCPGSALTAPRFSSMDIRNFD
jgi:hypothetical protein